MQEKIENRVLFGELGHPTDREETDMEKIAICLSEKPKIGDDGNLYGVFDILDTPNGRILKALCDYGCNIGVSSRGTGDVITDEDGNEAVDPETYECECWDAVLIPAVESARLNYVTESLDKKHTLKQALKESLDKATDDEKRVMTETLKELNINVDEKEECNSEDCTDKEDEESNKTKEQSEEAINDGSKELVNSLKEAIKAKSELENTIKTLQEQLAVSNAKVNDLEEENSRSKSTIVRLTSVASKSKENAKKVSELEESLKLKVERIKILENLSKESKRRLRESHSDLSEQLSEKETQVKVLTEKYEKQLKQLNETLNKEKETLNEKINSLNSEVNRNKSLVETYKKKAYNTVEKYIETKATMLGVSVNQIKNRLGESYTLNDIDKTCDELRDYGLRINKLPFQVPNKSVVKIKESVPASKIVRKNYEDDDCDFDSLVKLAG